MSAKNGASRAAGAGESDKGTQGPFTTIESALEFLTLFDVAVTQTLTEIRGDLAAANGTDRKSDALRLAIYKLEKLEYHITRSRRMANDLHMLRRLVFEERSQARATHAGAVAPPPVRV